MPRKVKGSSFHFGTPLTHARATANAFYTWLESKNGVSGWPDYGILRDAPNDQPKHKIWVQNVDGYLYGVIRTSEDDRNEHHEEQQDGVTILRQTSVSDGVPAIELNFICMHNNLRNGIYAHYRKSVPFGTFLQQLWAAYRAFVTEIKNAADPATQKTYSLYKLANTIPLYNTEGFRRLVESLRCVKEVRVGLPEYYPPDDAPPMPNMRGIHHTFRLIDASGLSAINFIMWLHQRASANEKRPRGSVIGETDGGVTMPIRFDHTLDDYLQIEHDQIGDVNTATLSTHDVLVQLKREIESNALFRRDFSQSESRGN